MCDDLRELILLDDFKHWLPEKIMVYLNEQKVTSLSTAAVLADEFTLTHKTVFSPMRRSNAAKAHITKKLPS